MRLYLRIRELLKRYYHLSNYNNYIIFDNVTFSCLVLYLLRLYILYTRSTQMVFFLPEAYLNVCRLLVILMYSITQKWNKIYYLQWYMFLSSIIIIFDHHTFCLTWNHICLNCIFSTLDRLTFSYLRSLSQGLLVIS